MARVRVAFEFLYREKNIPDKPRESSYQEMIHISLGLDMNLVA